MITYEIMSGNIPLIPIEWSRIPIRFTACLLH